MARFIIERHFGSIDEEELDTAAARSLRVAEERFPEIVWEHSHVIASPEGFITYCIYSAPSEQYVRDHAAASKVPCDRVHVIASTVRPDDLG